MMENGDYSLKRIGGNSLGAVDNYWFPHLFTPKVASSALEILARCPTLLRFAPCIACFLTQNPLRKPNINSPFLLVVGGETPALAKNNPSAKATRNALPHFQAAFAP